MKTYHEDLLKNRKISIILFLVGYVGLVAEIVATYYIGNVKSIFFLSGDGMRWNMWFNPFEWFFAFGAFNLFRSFHFHNLFINRLSSLSLLIYLIHENFLVRDYWRPYLYVLIHDQFHNQHVAWYLFLAALVTFLVSAVLARFYQKSFQKFVYRLADHIAGAVRSYT
jgi:hypothetical protein